MESALPTIVLLLRHKRRLAAVTLACTSSPICPAMALLPHDFTSPYAFMDPRSLRLPKWNRRLTGPLPWKATTTSRIRIQLPLDDLAHRTLPFVPSTGSFPPCLTYEVQFDFHPPPDPLVTWPALRSRVRTALLEEWAAVMLPANYPFGLTLYPYPFMGLPKFLAGRIHQMRSPKSYLAVHRPSW